jgi:hypothetical protein
MVLDLESLITILRINYELKSRLILDSNTTLFVLLHFSVLVGAPRYRRLKV